MDKAIAFNELNHLDLNHLEMNDPLNSRVHTVRTWIMQMEQTLIQEASQILHVDLTVDSFDEEDVNQLSFDDEDLFVYLSATMVRAASARELSQKIRIRQSLASVRESIEGRFAQLPRTKWQLLNTVNDVWDMVS